MASFDFGTPLLQGGDVQGLLGNPLFTGGLGLLAGAFDDDVSFGQSIGLGLQGAQQGLAFQDQRLQNEANREALRQRARQDRARQELFQQAGGRQIAPGTGQGFGLLTPAEVTDRTSLDMNEDFGLFAQAFPDQAGELLMSQFQGEEEGDPLVTLGNGMRVNFSELPSDAQQLVAAGLVPGTDEFNQIIQQSIANGGATAADRIMAQANATLAQLEVAREQRSERARAFDSERAITNTFSNLREIRRINDRLRGTIGETGLGADGLRQAAAQGLAAVKAFTGFGDNKAGQVLNDIKRLETLALKENVGNIGTLKENLGGRVTQFEFEKFIETGPSPTNPPDVNNAIILDQLKSFKELARFQEVTVPQWVDDEIDRLESDLSTEGTATVGDPEITPRAGGSIDLGDGVTLEFE